MPMEFFNGRPLEPEVRAIVERNWQHLLAKFPPEDDNF